MWLNLASIDEEKARGSRDLLEKKMAPEEVGEGQRMTREWLAPHRQQAR